ncbi:AI-2E family transporter [Sphingobium sp. MP9-4]|uniref:AI-2E family transporter n=1 Tax=Sphingobium sp. MP9-4 TaxID=1761936 RepID=UPI0010CA8D4B|nr:AI-2E family transporter [Sphingobium sp. MP9-4]TKV43562.1 AI-2E family transporter [Sphingobium sp. MP9-4]
MISRERIDNGGLILFIAISTLGLGLIVSGFISALLWAALAALLFQPLYRRILFDCRGRRNMAAALTLLIIIIAVIMPALIIGSLVIEQASGVYAKIRSGQIDFVTYFGQVHAALLMRLQQWVENAGFGTFERAQAKISQALSNSASILTQRALTIGADAAAFVLSFGVGLYVSFFLLRDGEALASQIITRLPLEPTIAHRIATRFVIVVRATIKGSGIVALAQGMLGAATFWIVGMPAALLWGVLMAIAALLPAIGPAIIWLPVATYLLATGDFWQAVIVVASGVFVIGLVDNLLRPMLVGRDTGLPDWLILVTTLGGIETLGLSGIVVGPIAAAFFLTGWDILAEQKAASTRD